MESLEEKQLKILKEMSKQLAVNCSEYLAAGIDSLALDYAQKYDALVGAIQALEEKE